MNATLMSWPLLPRARRGTLTVVLRDHELADELLQQRVKARLFGDPGSPVKVGSYTLLGRIGEGGMGVVYRAHDPELDRSVALKLMHPDLHGASERIRDEARALARLAHPNVVPVFEIGEHEGRLFVAMEFVAGDTLRTWLEGQVVRAPAAWRRALAVRPRALPAVLDCFLQAARGLQAAHAAGLVHRDFKPDNVLVGADGRVRVVDFGIASHAGALMEAHGAELRAPLHTTTGELAGTPAYMAPEQFAGGRVDARSDQFALCVALYEAVCGARPFAGEQVEALMRSVTAGELRPPPRWLPEGLRAALARGLQRDPERRFPDMSGLISALERATRRRVPALAAGAVAGLGLAWAAVAAPPVPVAENMSQEPGGPTVLQQAWQALPTLCLPEAPVTDWRAFRAETQPMVAEARKHPDGSPENLAMRAKLAGRMLAFGEDREFVCRWTGQLLGQGPPPASAERLRCLLQRYCGAPTAVSCPTGVSFKEGHGCSASSQCGVSGAPAQAKACGAGDAACCTSALIVREFEQLEANTANLPASKAELLGMAQQGCKLGVAMHCQQAAQLGGAPRAELLKRACELGLMETCEGAKKKEMSGEALGSAGNVGGPGSAGAPNAGAPNVGTAGNVGTANASAASRTAPVGAPAGAGNGGAPGNAGAANASAASRTAPVGAPTGAGSGGAPGNAGAAKPGAPVQPTGVAVRGAVKPTEPRR